MTTATLPDSIPFRVRFAIMQRADRFDALESACRMYGNGERAEVEFLAHASRPGWLEDQMRVERQYRRFQKIADRKGWDWQEIERTVLRERFTPGRGC